MASAPNLLICPGPKHGDTEEADGVHALIKGEGYLSQKKIAEMLGLHHETVKCTGAMTSICAR
jgi:hypothetical protein